MNKFSVLEYKWNSKEVRGFNIIPYFKTAWNNSSFDKSSVHTKEELKEWILRASKYQFWSRCEYECIISPWPYNDTSKESIIKDMCKIDVHFQIEMNIDIITDILFKEFKL